VGLGVDSTGWHLVMGVVKPAPGIPAMTLTNSTGVTHIAAQPWDGLCQVCHERPGTEEVHGCPGGIYYQCRQCGVESQLKHAREQSARIPELEKELEQLTKGTP